MAIRKAGGRWGLLLLVGACLGAAGCRSDPGPPAYLPPPGASMPQGRPAPPAQQAAVYFQGPFAYPTVPWAEGLRLAEGLFLAEYEGGREPLELVIIRRGQSFRVRASRLLRGQENPLLEPGDIVQILR